MDFAFFKMCASIDGPITKQVGKYVVSDLFSERHQPSCTCPAFKFCKGPEKTCKHIQREQKEVCGWHEQYSGGEPKDGKCPKCGGELVVVKCAV